MLLTSVLGSLVLFSSAKAPVMSDLDHGAEVVNARLIDGKLYLVGKFQKANRKTVNNVAVWDGTSWSGLGKGVDGIAYDICKVGSDIYVCGDFSYAGKSSEEPGVPANRIARWDGTKWNALATNTVDREIFALATDGKSLYVGGNFTKINNETATKSVAKWNGAKFEAIGGKFDRFIKTMVWANDKLYVGGYFNNFGDDEMKNVAMWDGLSWSEMGSGGLGGTVTRLATDGKSIFAAGEFRLNDKACLAKFDGSAWSSVIEADDSIKWVYWQDDKFYLAGTFSTIGGKKSRHVAILDGKKMNTLGEVPYATHTVLMPFKDRFIIGGKYSDVRNDQVGGVLKWDGSSSIDKLDMVNGG